jgi:hypothetical protein
MKEVHQDASRFLRQPEVGLCWHLSSRVHNEKAVRTLKNLVPGQRLRRWTAQHATFKIKSAAMTGTLVAPFHFSDGAPEVRTNSRHRLDPRFSRNNKEAVIRKEDVGPWRKVLRLSNLDHACGAKR